MATKNGSKKPVSEVTQLAKKIPAKKKSSAPVRSTEKNPIQAKTSDTEAARPEKKSKTSNPVVPKKSKTVAKKSTSKKGKRAYSLMGELTITTSPVPPVTSSQKTFKTPEIMVDELGNMFTKTSLELTIDSKRKIGVLDAEDAAYLLKILRVAPHD